MSLHSSQHIGKDVSALRTDVTDVYTQSVQVKLSLEKNHLTFEPCNPADCSSVSAGQSPEEAAAVPPGRRPLRGLLHRGAASRLGAVHQQVSFPDALRARAPHAAH